MLKGDYIDLIKSYISGYFEETKTKPELNKLCILGLRKETKSSVNFEDFIIVFLTLPEKTQTTGCHVFKATTTPSNYWLKNFLSNNKKGTAILEEGYHKDCWAFGYHKQDRNRPALVQIAPLPVYRDGNGDEELDYTESTIETKGLIGINFHTRKNASLSNIIGDISAGCQVIKNKQNFEEHFIPYVRTVISRGQKTFSYLLKKVPNSEIDRIEAGWSQFEHTAEKQPNGELFVVNNL